MKKLITSIMAIALVSLFIAMIPNANATINNPVPKIGTATIDGDTSEWILGADSPDAFAYLYTGWDTTKPALGIAYLRYDTTNDIVYVLALANTGLNGIVDSSKNWIATSDADDEKISNKVVTGTQDTNGVQPEFAYVYSGGNVIGYEASFKLDPAINCYLAIHLQINTPSVATAGTGDKTIPLEIPPDMQVPEYALGGLIAVGACFAALFVFKKRQTIFKTKI